MGVRSTISTLPDDVRQALERKLVSNGFADYAGLASWLQEQGFQISRSALHRFGSKFEDRLEAIRLATAQAQEITNAYSDEGAAVPEAALQLSQGLLLNLLLERGESLKPQEIALINRALADASRATVGLKKYQAEVRAKLDSLVKEAEQPGAALDMATIVKIREQVYGIFS